MLMTQRPLATHYAWRPLLGFRLDRLHRLCDRSMGTLLRVWAIRWGRPGGGAGGAGAGGAGVGGTGIGGAGGTSAGGTDTGGATSRGTRVGGTGGETVATCSTWHMRNVPAGTIFYLHLLGSDSLHGAVSVNDLAKIPSE
ncbi:unnamed protein product [Closterium sp. NIES-53]